MALRLERSSRQTRASRVGGASPIIRLDLVANPYGPCPAAMDAAAEGFNLDAVSLAAAFRSRLSALYRLPIEAIHCLSSADGGLRGIIDAHSGPLVGFPPSAAATIISHHDLQPDAVWIARGSGRDGIVGPHPAADIPHDGMAIIDSPSDPLGLILSPADTVRLSRACRSVVIDERYAEYSATSLAPLALELDNVIVLRSFESWAGLQDPPCAWAIASPRLAASVGLGAAMPAPAAMAAALASLDHRASIGETLKLVREERSRLYRFLRRLSFLEPLPSWAPFLAARVEIVPREAVVDGLLARGIRVHAPEETGLEQYIRISIGSRSAMDRLRAALVDLAPSLIG